MRRLAHIPWRWWRRAVQAAFVLLFLWLFRRTEFNPAGDTPGYVNLFFRLDPLAAAAATLGSRTIVLSLVLPALAVLVLSAMLGRFFCGWFCPLGTLLDWWQRMVRPISRRIAPFTHSRLRKLRHTRYVLLVVVLLGALLGLPLVGYVDPFAILTRGLATAVDPAIFSGTSWLFGWLYIHGSEQVTNVSEPVYAWLKAHVLPGQQTAFLLAMTSASILLGIFAMELVGRRVWCRYVCPLGAMVGLGARVAPLRRIPPSACKGCGECRPMCRMGAFDEQGKLAPEACNLCMDCVDECPREVARFGFQRRLSPPAPMEPSRRFFLKTAAAGLAIPLVAKAARVGTQPASPLLRPPGVQDDAAFLDACIRCGQCLKVCPPNGLQPALLESGLEGMFAPHLVPAMGYCEYNCTLCGTVCPTGAIPKLTLEDKQKQVMGRAIVDRNACLPWAENNECICCEEHCPVPTKAIKLTYVKVPGPNGRELELARPEVDAELCIGCGICENKCPLQEEGRTGIRVVHVSEAPAHQRHRGRRRHGRA